MYCPKCGNQQTSDDLKFCVKCGLPLSTTARMLASTGPGMDLEVPPPGRKLSPRARGVLQGIAIVPASLGAWLALDIFFEGVLGAGMLGGLYAMFTLIVLVALGRISYAIFFEGPAARHREANIDGADAIRTHLDAPANMTNALPAPNLSDIYVPPLMPLSGEFAAPDSVTDSTTRKLK